MQETLDTPEVLESLGFFKDGYKILDIGCGYGFIPKWISKNNKNVEYIGIDVRIGAIVHCTRLNLGEKFKFHHANVRNSAYNSSGQYDSETYSIPVDSGSIDSIICHSLFTHLDTESIASHYMSEIKRVLRPRGLLWTTWFTNPPNEDSDGAIRTVYDKSFIDSLLSDMTVIYRHGGHTESYHDQFEVACVK